MERVPMGEVSEEYLQGGHRHTGGKLLFKRKSQSYLKGYLTSMKYYLH